MKTKYKKIYYLSIFLLSVSCQQNNKSNNENLYYEAEKALKIKNPQGIIEKLEKLEILDPNDSAMPEIQILKAYTYYLEKKPEQVLKTLQEFEKLFPTHKNLNYMYYLVSMSYYTKLMDLGRDKNMTEKCFLALQKVSNFDNTEYANDAKQKLPYVVALLAGKEMNIGLFYLKQKNYIAAINRFQTVVEVYDNSIFRPEALYRLFEVYRILGVQTECEKCKAILCTDYKDSDWCMKLL